MFPFFRDRPVGGSFWQRFRTAAEGFTVMHEDGKLWEWHVVTHPERLIGLFHDLIGELPDVVSIEITDAHADRTWKGERCDRTGVRGAIVPLRAGLIADGGVEITVFGDADQITLNPVLELFVYSKTPRWTDIIAATGLNEERLVRTQSWKLRSRGLTPAPDLSAAVEAAADSLRLTRV